MNKNYKSGITAHMVVKNDDRWVWYAIMSVLPYVDRFLITDTGSSDRTVEIIKKISHPNLEFNQIQVSHPKEVVEVRRQHLRQSKTPWIWMVDADEIYSQKLIKEIKDAIVKKPSREGIVVRRYDLLGDIYHYQPDEKVGGYQLFDQTAHYSPRLIRTSIPGLKLVGEYPNEGFVVSDGSRLIDHDQTNFYLTKNRYLHTTYLTRSSLGSNLHGTFHRMKYKVEWGRSLPPPEIPEVFNLKAPSPVLPPTSRGLLYETSAALITPMKLIKRRFS